MATISDQQIAAYAQGAGFKGTGLQIAIAVALAESGGDPKAKGDINNPVSGASSNGLWQINSYYHKEVSINCATTPACAASAAFKISGSGGNWQPWSTYNNGAYKNFMARASKAIAGMTNQTGNPPPNPTPTPPPPQVTSGTVVTNYQLLPGTGNPIPDPQQLAFTGTSAQLKQQTLYPFYQLLAVGILFGFLFAISRTRAGYAAIYYGEALIVFFLFVTQAQFIKQHLSTFTGLATPPSKATSNVSVVTLSQVTPTSPNQSPAVKTL